jgi:hypothetical protein
VRARIERFATTNVEAFRAFSQGLDLKDQGRFTEARESFRRAAELDPGFGLAAEQQQSRPDVNVSSALQLRAVMAAAAGAAVDRGKTAYVVDLNRALAALQAGQEFSWGAVWEWTASAFEPYPGFVAHPYQDYSAPWFGSRRAKWSNTFQSTETVLGNRGPCYSANGTQATLTWSLVPAGTATAWGNTRIGAGSTSLLIHGGRTSWEGNLAYNDNHVDFATRPDPETNPFTFSGITTAGQRSQPDNVFVAERDTDRTPETETGNLTTTGSANGALTTSSNNYLRLWNGGTQSTPSAGGIPTTTAVTLAFD